LAKRVAGFISAGKYQSAEHQSKEHSQFTFPSGLADYKIPREADNCFLKSLEMLWVRFDRKRVELLAFQN